jgi:hypothetical protein
MDQREGSGPEGDRFDLDRLDYETTVKRFEHITDIRFKLLGLVPTATGLGALVADANRRTPDVAIAIGALGLLVIIGIIVYEIRNTQLYDALWLRAICLEADMGFRPIDEAYQYGGSFLGQPHDRRTIIPRPRWTIRLGHTLAIALVYGASVGVWVWVIVSGAFAKSSIQPRLWPWVIGALAGIAAGSDLLHLRKTGDFKTPGYMHLLPERFREARRERPATP